MKHISRQQGFSLVEFLIYFVIFSAVAVLLVNLLLTTVRGSGQVEARAEVQQNMRYSLLRISQAIRAATGISGTPGATLCLTMSDSAKNPTQFDVSSNVLRIAEGSGGGACPPSNPAQAITSDKVNVTSLTFTKISNPSPAKDTVQISITIAYKDNGNPQLVYSRSEQTTVSLKQ